MSGVSNPIRFGSNTALAAPAYDDLWLPIYGGEVLTRYNEFLGVTANMKRRNITTGNTARFPRTGGLSAERHAIGTKLLGLDAPQTEVSIGLDERPLVSHFRLDDVDQAMSHYEVRSEYAMQAGQALAESQDRYSLRLAINASRATPTALYGGANSPFPGGGIDGAGGALDIDFLPGDADGRPDADEVGRFLDALDQIVERWDVLRVRMPMRMVWTTVQTWHGIRQFGMPKTETALQSGQLPVFMGRDGRFGAGMAPDVQSANPADFNSELIYNGFRIKRTNLHPFGQDLSSDDEAKYQGNFTNTRAIAVQQEAVGVVVKMDVQTESERDISRRDWLFVTSMLSGGGTLRAEAAVEISDDA